ncbi:MAG: Yip1 family protein [Saccharofermentanales bacterium]
MGRIRSLKYSLYIIFHPFNGFWDLKHEAKADSLSALIIVIILTAVSILKTQLTGFAFNSDDPRNVNILAVSLMVIVPFFLWCISNYAITTLVDGKGKFKDIFIATAYSLVPMILFNIPMMFLSNIITLQEVQLYLLLDTISVIWSASLLFIAMMTIHDFTIMKTTFSVIITIVGILIISVLFLLFFSLFQQLYNFFYLIYRELSLR